VRDALRVGAGQPSSSIHVFLRAFYTPKGEESRIQCNGDQHTAMHCKFDSRGSYDVRLYVNPEEYGMYAYAGSVEVNATP
jgi:hypothetical protein